MGYHKCDSQIDEQRQPCEKLEYTVRQLDLKTTNHELLCFVTKILHTGDTESFNVCG